MAIALSRKGFEIENLIVRSRESASIVVERIESMPQVVRLEEISKVTSEIVFLTTQDSEIEAAAEKLAVETLLGSARLLARKNIEPETLRDQVTSPNGTTYAGLQRLKAGDFRGLIRETVLAATARSKELSQDS